ncbi:unnamed protein product [Coffea canephora]|uniref:Uncharacterized protein n=1 Tax=Coffea canephora TaxID=49390 RepID=A0A068USX9_COFCA|nr:unnamed protein product [Coffea canephora]
MLFQIVCQLALLLQILTSLSLIQLEQKCPYASIGSPLSSGNLPLCR